MNANPITPGGLPNSVRLTYSRKRVIMNLEYEVMNRKELL